MDDELGGKQSVVVVSFHDDSNAYEALTSIKQLDSQRQIDLGAAAVIARGEDGRVVVKDEVGEVGVVGTATGGLLGLLIGIIGGPLWDTDRRSDRTARWFAVRRRRRR